MKGDRMKRFTLALVGGLFLVAVLPGMIAASPTCGSLPEFRAYDGNNQTGLLGVLCPQSSTLGTDADFSNAYGSFQGSDNDKLNSWKFYNPTGSTWCLEIFANKDFSGTGRWYNLGPTSTYWYPVGGTVGPTFENTASSVRISQGSC